MKYPAPIPRSEWRGKGYLAYRIHRLRIRLGLWIALRLIGAESAYLHCNTVGVVLRRTTPEWPTLAFNVDVRVAEPQTELEDLTEPAPERPVRPTDNQTTIIQGWNA